MIHSHKTPSDGKNSSYFVVLGQVENIFDTYSFISRMGGHVQVRHELRGVREIQALQD